MRVFQIFLFIATFLLQVRIIQAQCMPPTVWHAGDPDICFDISQQGFDVGAKDVFSLNDGRILTIGTMTRYNREPVGSITRIKSAGLRDTSFHFFRQFGGIYCAAPQPDGKIVVSYQNNGPVLARLLTNGMVDTTFRPTIPGSVLSLAIQSDGKILISGEFGAISGNLVNQFGRLSADGSFDPTFNSRGLSSSATKILVQPDGKVLAAGGFERSGDSSRIGLTRFLTNGELDINFRSYAGFGASYNSLILQPDGSILVGGTVGSYGGQNHTGIFRVKPDGKADSSFHTGSTGVGYVNCLALQADGKVLVGSSLPPSHVFRVGELTRFLANGNLDTNFVSSLEGPTGGGSTSVNGISIALEGKIIIVGNFNSYRGTDPDGIARLYSDSSRTTATVGLVVNPIILVPNPSQGNLYLRGIYKPVVLTIRSLSGRVVYTKSVYADENLSIEGLPAGLYCWQVGGQSGRLLFE